MPLGSAQSLITRCPDCATAFRASPEQLSLRHGLVRCGRCNHVFDARAHAVEIEPAPATPTAGLASPTTASGEATDDEPLYDATSFIAATDEELPADVPASGTAAETVAEEHAGAIVPEPHNPLLESAPDSSDDSPTAEGETELPVAAAEPTTEPAERSVESGNVSNDDLVRPFAEGLDEAGAEPLKVHAQQDAPAVSTSEPVQDESPASSTEAGTHDNTEHPDDAGPVTAGDADSPADEPATAVLPDDRLDPIDAAVAAMPPLASEPAEARVASTVEPLELEFGAPRNAQPGLSKWLGIPAAILLLAALTAQIAYHLRGDLVLLFPSVRAAAVQWCDWAGCDLPSPQRAELMSIEASDLQADSINPAVMVLSATLRNRAPFAQAQPALELTLTDAQGQPVARRVISTSDYVIAGIQNGVFPASSELPMKIYFEASAVKATGYRLYLFYP